MPSSGSTFKLHHKNANAHLTTSKVSWASGNQAVTAIPPDMTSANALWQFFAQYKSESNRQVGFGSPVLCHEIVRVYHPASQAYLRASPKLQAPLSHRAEISAHGDENNAENNWRIECSIQTPGSQLLSTTMFKLRHINSGLLLNLNKQAKFNQQNCRGCPIQGHFEVAGLSADSGDTLWDIADGFFIPQNEDRVVYDYSDMSSEVKIINEKTGKHIENQAKKTPHDEL